MPSLPGRHTHLAFGRGAVETGAGLWNSKKLPQLLPVCRAIRLPVRPAAKLPGCLQSCMAACLPASQPTCSLQPTCLGASMLACWGSHASRDQNRAGRGSAEVELLGWARSCRHFERLTIRSCRESKRASEVAAVKSEPVCASGNDRLMSGESDFLLCSFAP